jgi:hypothetical protein
MMVWDGDENPLAAARGCLLVVAICAPIWVVLILLAAC